MRKVFLWFTAIILTFTFSGCFAENSAETDRYSILMPNTEGITVPVFSEDGLTIKQFEIPDNDAMAFVKELKAGWNLGNAFDAYDDNNYCHGLNLESYWCHAKTTREMIHVLKESGFNLVRIPVSWHNHLTDNDYTIDPAWMNRILEVASWIVEEDMFFIINIHHDNWTGYLYPDSEHYEQSEKYICAIWKQIADAFADFDEHCIFESMNEPRLVGTTYEWTYNENSAKQRDAMECINNLNQKFVDTVRSAGGNNITRYLVVPSYCAKPEAVLGLLFRMPEDTEENRIIIAVHAYTPYDFALNLNSSDSSFDLEKDKQKISAISTFMNQLYNRYIKVGIPVIIDEFGVLNKNGNLQDRVNYSAFYIAAASARGMTCCVWDNHVFSGTGEQLGILDRKKAEWIYPDIARAIISNCLYNR